MFALIPGIVLALPSSRPPPRPQVDVDCTQRVVVYDQSSQDVASLAPDCFLTVLLGKLEKSFSSVHLLAGKGLGVGSTGHVSLRAP